MRQWLKRLLKGGAVAASVAASAAQAEPQDPFAIYIEAAGDFLGDDAAALDFLRLARDDPEAYARAQSDGSATLMSDYTPGEDLIGSLFRDVLIERRHLVYLDWKDGPDEFAPLYDEQMARLGLPPLTDAQHSALATVAQTPPPGLGRAYFPNYLPLLDEDATAKGYRVLVFDESADSYAFLLATPAQFARWADTRLGPYHRFFSPASFISDQMR